MNIENLNKILEEEVEKPPMTSKKLEQKEQKEAKKRKKKTFFLGEKPVKPSGQVIFENSTFFVERNSGCSFVIKPKTVMEYLKLKPKKRSLRITKGATRIVVPLMMTNENPMKYFKEKYVDNIQKRNHQSKFIREIWKEREAFKEMMIG